MEEKYRLMIAAEFLGCIKNTIERLDNEETNRPFHAALLSSEALFWSRFERSFSTSFGQRVIEKVAKEAALAGGATEASNGKATTCSLTLEQLAAVDAHIAALRGGSSSKGWETDLAEVKAAGGATGAKQATRVISDIWWIKDGVNYYMSSKTVKPNIDQTAEAKRDLLKLKLHDPGCKVFYGLPYNPYGEKRENYNWKPPMGIFDFRRDSVVLIGKDYWDTLGGLGSYDEMLKIAKEVGKETRALLENLVH